MCIGYLSKLFRLEQFVVLHTNNIYFRSNPVTLELAFVSDPVALEPVFVSDPVTLEPVFV